MNQLVQSQQTMVGVYDIRIEGTWPNVDLVVVVAVAETASNDLVYIKNTYFPSGDWYSSSLPVVSGTMYYTFHMGSNGVTQGQNTVTVVPSIRVTSSGEWFDGSAQSFSFTVGAGGGFDITTFLTTIMPFIMLMMVMGMIMPLTKGLVESKAKRQKG